MSQTKILPLKMQRLIDDLTCAANDLREYKLSLKFNSWMMAATSIMVVNTENPPFKWGNLEVSSMLKVSKLCRKTDIIDVMSHIRLITLYLCVLLHSHDLSQNVYQVDNVSRIARCCANIRWFSKIVVRHKCSSMMHLNCALRVVSLVGRVEEMPSIRVTYGVFYNRIVLNKMMVGGPVYTIERKPVLKIPNEVRFYSTWSILGMPGKIYQPRVDWSYLKAVKDRNAVAPKIENMSSNDGDAGFEISEE